MSDTAVRQRAVFISGAAAGIGAATARAFAAQGWIVGIYDLDAAGADALASELNLDLAGAAVAGPLDVTDPTSWAQALDAFVEAAGGELDLLINNAGILRGGRFADVPLAEHRATVRVNVEGVMNGCHAAHRYLAATPGAGVINLCSASAIYGQAELASYSASKFAIRGLTEALELEWRAEDISVQAVWPLFVATAMTDGLAIGSTETLGVRLSAEEVAETIVAMARPRGGLIRRLPHSVHRSVGLPARVLATTANLVPSFVTREVTRRITHT